MKSKVNTVTSLEPEIKDFVIKPLGHKTTNYNIESPIPKISILIISAMFKKLDREILSNDK